MGSLIEKFSSRRRSSLNPNISLLTINSNSSGDTLKNGDYLYDSFDKAIDNINVAIQEICSEMILKKSNNEKEDCSYFFNLKNYEKRDFEQQQNKSNDFLFGNMFQR